MAWDGCTPFTIQPSQPGWLPMGNSPVSLMHDQVSDWSWGSHKTGHPGTTQEYPTTLDGEALSREYPEGWLNVSPNRKPSDDRSWSNFSTVDWNPGAFGTTCRGATCLLPDKVCCKFCTGNIFFNGPTLDDFLCFFQLFVPLLSMRFLYSIRIGDHLLIVQLFWRQLCSFRLTLGVYTGRVDGGGLPPQTFSSFQRLFHAFIALSGKTCGGRNGKFEAACQQPAIWYSPDTNIKPNHVHRGEYSAINHESMNYINHESINYINH